LLVWLGAFLDHLAAAQALLTTASESAARPSFCATSLLCLFVLGACASENGAADHAAPAMQRPQQAAGAGGSVAKMDAGVVGPPSATSGQRAPQPTRKDASVGSAQADEDASSSGVTPPLTAADAKLVIGETEALAAITGQYGPARTTEQLYAADLGWMVRDHDRMWVLFGDSWTNALVRTIDPMSTRDADDAIGTISLVDFPDGASVERFIRSSPVAAGQLSWQATPPPIQFAVNPSSSVATPMLLVRDGTTLSSGGALTPLTGFSDERDGLFSLFFRNSAVQCSAGSCDAGRTCDTGLGLCTTGGQPPTDLSVPCVIGSPSTSSCEACVVVPGQGLCVDTGSSVYDANVARGRSGSVAVTHEIGNMLHDSDHVFATQPWITQRYYTTTARSVRVFDPAAPQVNDYRVLQDAADERAAVLLWGRPNLGGVHKQGRGLSLYFAYAPMPSYQDDGHFEWQPRFFAGLDSDGKPRFVTREVDSVALDLDAAMSGEQTEEIVDVCGHMTVVYMPTLGRWMMLYGSSIQELYTSLVYGDDAQYIDRSTLGNIYVRYATQPWGPWSAPELFAQAGDAASLTGFFAPGSFLRSTSCNAADCVRAEVTLPTENGGVYSPHIIEPWLQPQADGVDVFWNISNWNPYEVILLKTPLRVQ